ncbi:MAG: ABC transporter substrate-binding protein [Treponema sp.]|nr:ABC transporter substrate-binding protein [Treponema sp.]
MKNEKRVTGKKQITNRMFYALLFAICYLLFAAGGCNQKSGTDTIRVLLDWTPNTNHTGLYAALEMGWFAEEGLKIEITQPPEDEALALLAAGRAEFAFSFQESMGPAITGRDALPVQAVAAVISHNTSGVMSLAGSNIRRPADLQGKRFASWETPLVTAVIRDIVENDGGDFRLVTMIPNFATDAFSALQTDVDAIWIYYAWDGIAAEVNGVDINYLDLGSIDIKFDFYTPVLVSGIAWAAENPEKTRKFLRAASRGYSFAMENPAEAAAILLKYAPELDAALVMRSQEYLKTRYQGDAQRWGEIDPERWGGFYKWMFEQDLLERDIGSGGFTNEYLP